MFDVFFVVYCTVKCSYELYIIYGDNTIKYCIVQTVVQSTIQYCTVQCSEVQYFSVHIGRKYNTVLHCTDRETVSHQWNALQCGRHSQLLNQHWARTYNKEKIDLNAINWSLNLRYEFPMVSGLTISDFQWQPVTASGSQWQPVTFGNSQWQSVTANYSQWQ